MRSLLDKKAQLGNLQIIITTLVVIGLFLGVGFIILEEVRDLLSADSTTVTNETQTISDTATAVDTATETCFNSFSLTSAKNATGGETILESGNYTYDTSAGTVTAVGSSPYNGTDWNLTYTYQSGRDACDGVVDSIDATQKIPAFLAIIAIISVIGVLLAIVFNVLPKAGGSA